MIFLDIDGVLNSVRYDRSRTPSDGNIDRTRLVLLRQLVEQTGAEIVLSSSWRRHWHRDAWACNPIGRELHTIFGEFGLHIMDKTPVLGPTMRAEEIEAWLEKHARQVESFVILDDIPSGWGRLGDHLVRTNSRIGRGLEQRHVEAAVRILNG